jgi:hypothetical protein
LALSSSGVFPTLLLDAQIVDEVWLKQQRARQIFGCPHQEHIAVPQLSRHRITVFANPQLHLEKVASDVHFAHSE